MRSLRKAAGVGLLVSALAGCAHGPAPRGRSIRLALLPAESEQFPAVATALNTSLRDAPVGGVDDRFLSKVSLEVVQLSIECVDPTAACYAAVGRALGADRLLLGQLAPGTEPAGSLRVTVTLFDVNAGAPLRNGARVFSDGAEAEKGVKELVAQVLELAASPPQGSP
jgi:hypothetical protein